MKTKTKKQTFTTAPIEMTTECMEKCCEKALEKLGTTFITYKVQCSKLSDSKYITLEIGTESFYHIRVSDHRNNEKHWDRQVIIKRGATKNGLLIGTIINCAKILQHKRIDFVFKKIV